MADLGCQDTDWEGENERGLDKILLQDGLILATFTMDKKNIVILGTFLVGLRP